MNHFYKCQNCAENIRKPKVGCSSTFFVILFSFLAQKQLIARTTVVPCTSCRPPLLVFTAALSLCLPCPEQPATGCRVVPSIGCGGYYRSFCFSSRTSSLSFWRELRSSSRRDKGGFRQRGVRNTRCCCVNRRLGAGASESDAEMKYYNRVLRARGRRLLRRQQETGSSSSIIHTDTMLFVLQ